MLTTPHVYSSSVLHFMHVNPNGQLTELTETAENLKSQIKKYDCSKCTLLVSTSGEKQRD